ncbi:FecR family protein [Sphingobacterium sp. LRF_L2]|uniref:FecR family protein n=1 Tax=Sphingobacterium sp. LRF_L2 TaxID=3369421 RepID=UPI003F63A7A3
MNNPTIEQLICEESFIHYCLESHPMDVEFWESWLKDNPQYVALVDEAKQFVIALANRPTQEERETARETMLAHLERSAVVPQRAVRKLVFRYWVAAACLLMVGTAVSLWFLRNPKELDSVTLPNIVHQEVPLGKRMNITLADGTKVRLTAGTKFDYPILFSDSLREVQLQGDAFFEVVHDATKPFVIKTGDFAVRVLGTSFNVHAFNEDDRMQVALFNGKVEVYNNDIKQTLSPGQSFNYNKKTNTFSVETFDKEEERASIEGILFFKQASFAEVGRKLSRKYGIIVPANPAIEMSFSGTIANESIEQVIAKLNFTTPYHFHLDSNTLIAKQK